jgi:hypothetical protein
MTVATGRMNFLAEVADARADGVLADGIVVVVMDFPPVLLVL